MLWRLKNHITNDIRWIIIFFLFIILRHNKDARLCYRGRRKSAQTEQKKKKTMKMYKQCQRLAIIGGDFAFAIKISPIVCINTWKRCVPYRAKWNDTNKLLKFHSWFLFVFIFVIGHNRFCLIIIFISRHTLHWLWMVSNACPHQIKENDLIALNGQEESHSPD